MRVGWIGPQPLASGGVPQLAGMILLGLAQQGIIVDAYFGTGVEPTLPLAHSGLTVISEPIAWEGGGARPGVLRHVSAQRARAAAQVRLASALAQQHAEAPYDVLYQFSQFELLGFRRFLDALPPIVVHPETHAAGELRWLFRERELARRSGHLSGWMSATATMAARAVTQRRDVRSVSGVVAPSRVFAEHLIRDYRVPPRLVHVVPNCIDDSRFVPSGRRDRSGPVKVLFVSRMSVRKGVEMLVALSHRLADLVGGIQIEAIGSHSTWSDYRPLLDALNPAVAHYTPHVGPDALARLYAEADILVQPSRFEPFALTVAEALACGLAVVVSDEVGAREGVDTRCCSVFADGNLDQFERTVRTAVVNARGAAAESVSALARAEAMRLFAPVTVATQIRQVLEGVAETGAVSRPVP